jgi:hypothetical protein
MDVGRRKRNHNLQISIIIIIFFVLLNGRFRHDSLSYSFLDIEWEIWYRVRNLDSPAFKFLKLIFVFFFLRFYKKWSVLKTSFLLTFSKNQKWGLFYALQSWQEAKTFNAFFHFLYLTTWAEIKAILTNVFSSLIFYMLQHDPFLPILRQILLFFWFFLLIW